MIGILKNNQISLTTTRARCSNGRALYSPEIHPPLQENPMSNSTSLPAWARLASFFALFCMAFAITLEAQNSTATILGHATDPSGAAVIGATVRVTNVATSVTRAAKTNPAGDYVFVNLPPGNYDVDIEASGFRKAKVEAARLDV